MHKGNASMKCALAVLLICSGCASASPLDLITPTIVPPLAEELGYTVPNIKGITTAGIIKGTLEVERLRLQAFDSSAHLTLKATQNAVDGVLTVLAALGLGGAPAAFMAGKKRKRPEDFTREEYEAAGRMEPGDFK
jgi:hypothetical protein